MLFFSAAQIILPKRSFFLPDTNKWKLLINSNFSSFRRYKYSFFFLILNSNLSVQDIKIV
jgi:hypothetical protein